MPDRDDDSKTKAAKAAPMDRTLIRDVAILSGSQLMLNLGFSQMVPVIPLFAAQMGGARLPARISFVVFHRRARRPLRGDWCGSRYLCTVVCNPPAHDPLGSAL